MRYCAVMSLRGEVVAALEEHHAARARGCATVSLLVGPPQPCLLAWGSWAARQHVLTLTTAEHEASLATAALLAQVPWLRALPTARACVAAAARLSVTEVDAAVAARGQAELARWLDDLAGTDDRLRVAGWLLAAAQRTEPVPSAPPPMPAEALLGILCQLAAPISILWSPPPQASLAEHQRSLAAAVALARQAPALAIGWTAPPEETQRLLAALDGTALGSLARHALIAVAPSEPAVASATATAVAEPGLARSRAERTLHDALAQDLRTRGHFALNVRVPVEGAIAEVDLLAASARLAVELDGWHHFRDADCYRRDRTKDVRLQRAGYFVMRFLSEDAHDRLALTVDQIATALERRLAAPRARPPAGDPPR